MEAYLDSYRLAPSLAVAHFRASELDGDALLRALATHPRWFVPGQNDAQGVARVGVLVGEDGRRVLEAWSELEFVPEEYRDRTVTVAGYVLFTRIQTYGVDRVSLDQDTEHAIFYLADQFELLGAWGAVGAVETALHHPDEVGDAFGVVHGFASFHILLRKHDTDADILLAPDAQDRELAAVFTAPDACRHFEETLRLAGVLGEVETEIVDGHRLFDQLQHAGLDGVVFNPLTPLPVRALRASAIPRILESPPWRYTSAIH
jgi:hypothetical protein